MEISVEKSAHHSMEPRIVAPEGFATQSTYAMFAKRHWDEEAEMVALKTERRVFLWRLTPRAVPRESNQTVTLEEVISILEAEFTANRAHVYLSPESRVLAYDDPLRDEKSQLYIAKIKRDSKSKTITVLINRGDPNAVSPAFIDSKTNAVRVEHPAPNESPGYSAHLVISTEVEAFKHRACFEKMSRVSSSLVVSAIEKIVDRAAIKRGTYTYIKKVKKGSKMVDEERSYRPTLGVYRVPSESLIRDLENGELSMITLTKKKVFYSGPGAENLVKRQEEVIKLHTSPSDKQTISDIIRNVVAKAKEEKFEDISFHLGKLPGGATNNPTLMLDDHDALEQLYVRAKRLADFSSLLEGCYSDICEEIQNKMISVVNGSDGWSG